MHAKNKGGGKNGKSTLAAMTMLLQGLSDGEEVMVMTMAMMVAVVVAIVVGSLLAVLHHMLHVA